MKNLKICGISDIGMVREENEDSFLILKFKDMLVAVVADGMGGHIGGKLASSTAVQTIKDLFDQNQGRLPLEELIEDCLDLGNQKIREIAEEKFRKLNIGTTCTLVVVSGNQKLETTFGHIGDSKLYHIRKNDIKQKSTDHTMLQKMLDAGALKPEEAEDYQHKNIIYKSLGGSENLSIDPIQKFPLEKGDVLLLCSDGLSGYLKPSEMVNILKNTKSIKDASRYIVNLAKHRGGDDNITAILVENGDYQRNRKYELEKIPKVKRKRNRGKLAAILVLITILATLVSLLVMVLKQKKTPTDVKEVQMQTVEESGSPESGPPDEEENSKNNAADTEEQQDE